VIDASRLVSRDQRVKTIRSRVFLVHPTPDMSVTIQSSVNVLESCHLDLMPFHIAHDGPAPIKTYFRPQPAVTESFPGQDGTLVDDTPVLETEEEGSTIPESTEPSQTDDMKMDAPDTSTPAIESIESMSISDPAPLTDPSPDPTRRLTAAFRGRIVQGLRVDLPSGYSGLVLRAPTPSSTSLDDSTTKSPSVSASTSKQASSAPVGTKSTEDTKSKKLAAAAAAKTKRASRRAKRAGVAVEPEPEVEVEPESHSEQPLDEGHEDQPMDEASREGNVVLVTSISHEEESTETKTKLLVPTGTFSSFVLWNPDISVDEGKDEYMRTLKEWIDISSEVRRFIAHINYCSIFTQIHRY
jgi:hypothetical protein